jgi:ribosomal protein L32E
VENYAEAEMVCAELKEHFPQQEESYMMYIRIYQSWRKPKKMQQKIRELKACPIELSGGH